MQKPSATRLIAARPPTAPDGPFWHPATIDELAQSQRVERVRSLADFIGGWPEDEIDDGVGDDGTAEAGACA